MSTDELFADERPDRRLLDRIKSTIEGRILTIAGALMRARVLSFHPSLSSNDWEREVMLRLDLSPYEAPVTGAAVDGTIEARLGKLGLTFPFRIDQDLEAEVDRLARAIEREAPQALERGESPRVIVVQPVPWPTKLLVAVAAVSVSGALLAVIPDTGFWRWVEGLSATAAALVMYEFIPPFARWFSDRISGDLRPPEDRGNTATPAG